ncbi:MAG: DMT family transporter [Thermoplasmata archaeon]|nr:DMT family transporter [Thermoplasmata archaeon]
MERNRLLAMTAVIIGATLFGFLGLCTRYFSSEFGMTSIDSVVVRLSFSSVFLLIMLGLMARSRLKIGRKDVPLLFLFGAFKFLSDLFYFYSLNTIHLGLTTLLQMTAPYYVMVISLLLFKEKLTAKKLVAMGIATMGSILVTGVLFGEVDSDLYGILSALMSGLFFGMFMIGSKLFNDRGIHPAASLFYTMLFADLLALPLCNADNLVQAVTDPEGILVCITLGVLMTLVPYFLYTWSTQYIEPTIVSTLAVLEVVAATLVGLFFFSEQVTALNAVGMGLVIMSVILVNVKIRRDYSREHGKYQKPKHERLYSRKERGEARYLPFYSHKQNSCRAHEELQRRPAEDALRHNDRIRPYGAHEAGASDHARPPGGVLLHPHRVLHDEQPGQAQGPRGVHRNVPALEADELHAVPDRRRRDNVRAADDPPDGLLRLQPRRVADLLADDVLRGRELPEHVRHAHDDGQCRRLVPVRHDGGPGGHLPVRPEVRPQVRQVRRTRHRAPVHCGVPPHHRHAVRALHRDRGADQGLPHIRGLHMPRILRVRMRQQDQGVRFHEAREAPPVSRRTGMLHPLSGYDGDLGGRQHRPHRWAPAPGMVGAGHNRPAVRRRDPHPEREDQHRGGRVRAPRAEEAVVVPSGRIAGALSQQLLPDLLRQQDDEGSAPGGEGAVHRHPRDRQLRHRVLRREGTDEAGEVAQVEDGSHR